MSEMPMQAAPHQVVPHTADRQTAMETLLLVAEATGRWVCTAHTLICINSLPLPLGGMILHPGKDARQTTAPARAAPNRDRF